MLLFLPPIPPDPPPAYVESLLPGYDRGNSPIPVQQVPPIQQPEAIVPLSPAVRPRGYGRAEGKSLEKRTGKALYLGRSPNDSKAKPSWPWTTPFPSTGRGLAAAPDNRQPCPCFNAR